MDAAVEQAVSEIKRLKACINNLISVQALPAIWSGGHPSQIVNALLDMLVKMLGLDFGYARLKDSANGGPLEMVRLAQEQDLTVEPQMIGRALNPWLGDFTRNSLARVRNPIGDGEVSVLFLRLGLQAEIGVFVAGSTRAEFPTQTERLLLNVAANQAAIGLQEARLLGEQKWVAEELDQRVAQRTSQLQAANEELEKEIVERDRAEAALRTSEEKYRDLINAAPDAICVIDADGVFVLVNPAGVELVGRPEEELIGSSIADTYLPEERYLLEHRIDRLKAEGSLRFERKFLRRNGEVIPVEVSLSALRGRYYQSILRDISDRKRSEEALRASEQVTRGQVEALAQSLDVLATAPAPEQFIGQMLGTICRQLDGQSVELWLLDETDESLVLRLVVEGENLVPSSQHPAVRGPPLWKQHRVVEDLIFTGAPVVIEDIETDPRVSAAVREYLKPGGTKQSLGVPILAGGKVKGLVSVRHRERPPYRPEEIELMQALAHQVMLALRLTELAEQSRRAAILEERNRMARDIHDTLAQGFTGVIMQLEAAEEAIEHRQPKQADEHLRRAGGLARKSLSEARRSVHALRPEALQEGTFWEALKSMIKSITIGTALHPSFKVKGKMDELPPVWQEHLLHIGQEALANTIKYAHAHKFGTRLINDPKERRLEFSDDGDGFKPQDRHDGRGLVGMRERVEQMGGELKITSARGKGTKIIVVLPL
jgi:PAS domain S-box-containing protein